MAFRKLRIALLAMATAFGCNIHAQAAAFLFWSPPDFSGAPVRGDEPGIGEPLPGATSEEVRANLLWNMRAGLNVAALQCQFAPELGTVPNYNNLLSQHAKELASAHTTLGNYFRRLDAKNWQVQFDQYTTRTYNSFSTLHAVYGFCETAGAIGKETLTRRRGDLYLTAEARMREFRNSLRPVYDGALRNRPYLTTGPTPPLTADCWDKKNRFRFKRCTLPVGLWL